MNDIAELKLDIYHLAATLQSEIAMMCAAPSEQALEKLYIKSCNNLVMLKDNLYELIERRCDYD